MSVMKTKKQTCFLWVMIKYEPSVFYCVFDRTAGRMRGIGLAIISVLTAGKYTTTMDCSIKTESTIRLAI